MMMGMVQEWANHDIDAALAFGADISDLSDKKGFYTQALDVWAFSEPEAAIDWALQNLDPRMGESIGFHLAFGYTRGNPENVRSIVDRFSGRVKHSLIMGVAGNWAMQDPVSAMEWIDGLEDLDTKNEARKGAAFSWLR